MDEIIKIDDVDGRQFVDARDLHQALGVQSAFKDWIARRIENFGFIVGQDFSSFLSESTGGRPAVEYRLSVEMAKELAMVENNEKGRAVRQYLIKIESAWNTPEMVFARALQMANKTIEDTRARLNDAETKLIQQQPKVETYDALVDRSYLRGFRDAAGTFGIRQSDLMRILKTKYIYANGHGGYRAYAEYADLFSLRAYEKGKAKGDQLMLTVAGIDYFRKLINE